MVIAFMFIIPWFAAILMPLAMMIVVLARVARLGDEASIAWLFFTLNALNMV